jgi:hypothetical protein
MLTRDEFTIVYEGQAFTRPLQLRNNGGDNESGELTTNVVTNEPTGCVQKVTI